MSSFAEGLSDLAGLDIVLLRQSQRTVGRAAPSGAVRPAPVRLGVRSVLKRAFALRSDGIQSFGSPSDLAAD